MLTIRKRCRLVVICHLVVIVKGKGLSPGARSALANPEPPLSELRFTSEFSRHEWVSANGRVICVGWESEPRVHETGPSWHVEDGRLTAVTGSLRVRGEKRPAGTSLAGWAASHVREKDARATAERTEGSFTLVSLDERGRGVAMSDFLGLRPLHVGETDEFFVISTQAEAAARVLSGGPDPGRDVLGVAGLAYSGFLIGDRTGFSGVRRLAGGESVRIRTGAVRSGRATARVQTHEPAPWAPTDDLRSLGRTELLTQVMDEIAEGVHFAASLPAEERRADLTGGRDSRLLFAIVLREGLQDSFRFRSVGPPELEDVIIGTEIAERFGLQHRAGMGFDPAPDHQRTAPYAERAQRFITAVGGMLNLWDMEMVRSPLPQIHLCGLGGELLRTYYPERQTLNASEDLLAMFDRRYGTSEILTRDAQQFFATEFQHQMLDDPTGEASLFDLLDLHYLRHQVRAGCGAREELDPRFRVAPLVTRRGVQIAFAMGPSERHRLTLHREPIEMVSPELAQIPILRGWADKDLELVEGPIDPVSSRTPRSPTPFSELAADGADLKRALLPPTLNSYRQVRHFDEGRDFFEAVISDEGNPMWDVVRRDRVMETFSGFARARWSQRYEFFGAMTGAVWLGS